MVLPSSRKPAKRGLRAHRLPGHGPARPASEADHLYRDIFEHCAWGIFQTTPDGRYLTANPALARIYGFDNPKTLLTALTDIGGQLYVTPGRREDFIALMNEQRAVSGFESQVRRRDGAIIWISETCREVRGRNGKLLYYEGTVEDITQRKQAEAALRAAKEEAEAASRAKTGFLATMSHELRTPLNAVIGFADIIQRELLGPAGVAAYRDYAGHIHASGQHLLAIINDILEFVRADNGTLPLEPEEIDVAELVQAAARQLADQAAAQSVHLVIEPTAGLYVQADRRRLAQVLLNLTGNALKFTPPDGRIALSSSRQPDGRVRMEVRDTGLGIPPDQLARVIEPFYQVDSSLTRRHDGAGLGLAICDRLVRLHGGSLSLASRPGEGTTATVVLPRHIPPRAKDSA